MHIFICLEAVDFRKGIDGLAGVCRNHLGENPISGALFAFRNKSKNAIKLLVYDGQGFWLCMKRLSKGSFKWWPGEKEASARELYTLLWNGNPELAQFTSEWKKII